MFKEFFEDIKLFEKESTWLGFKWMKFEFYFRQPFGMASLLVLIIIRLIQNDSREGYIPIAAMGIDLLVWMLLIFFCMLRKKYSFYCLMAVFVLQAVSIPITRGFGFWNICIALVQLFFLYIYFFKREEFFYKERFLFIYKSVQEKLCDKEEQEKINREKAIIGGAIGISLTLVIIALLLCIKEQNYLHKPAKVVESVSFGLDDTWDAEQAEVIAKKWTNAVEMEDIEEIQEIIEEMLIEQEEKVKCFFFFEKSEFQAGIDQKKCSDVLACIDAEKQGMAYYSLARIGHYYDVRQGNHKLEVETKPDKNGISILIQHGRVKTELAFVDMNEVVGEEGKENLGQKNFSYEDITSVLGNIYTDEDISFVGELAKAADKEAYAQVFKKDPDRLSAVGQEALYQYAYILMNNGVKYDRHLYVTKQDLGQLEDFSNGLLQTLSNKKREDYCERYLKILADKSKYRMNAFENKVCEIYKQKEEVISILPEFCLNSQLNILFSCFEFCINQSHIYKGNKCMQTEELQFGGYYGRLLDDSMDYIESIWKKGEEETSWTVRIEKHTAYSYINNTETALFGDTVTYGRKVAFRGKHDANVILKEAWLQGEGLSFMATPEMKAAMEMEFYPEQKEDSVIYKYRWLETLSLSQDDFAPILYLVWSGKPYENGSKNRINDISSLSIDDIVSCMDVLDRVVTSNEFLDKYKIGYYSISLSAYADYNIIDDYYFEGEEKGQCWVNDYIDILSNGEFVHEKYVLVNINGDEIPDLIGLDEQSGYQVCTSFGNGAVCSDKVYYEKAGVRLYYLPGENSIICIKDDGETNYKKEFYLQDDGKKLVEKEEKEINVELGKGYKDFDSDDFMDKEEMIECIDRHRDN